MKPGGRSLDDQRTAKAKEAVQAKKEAKKHLTYLMIKLYCRHHHKGQKNKAEDGGGEDELCPVCRDLYNYAAGRTQACRFTETVKFCKHCPVHCYRPDYREKIRCVMRYAGPRMLFYCPGQVVSHLISSLKENLKRHRSHLRKREK